MRGPLNVDIEVLQCVRKVGTDVCDPQTTDLHTIASWTRAFAHDRRCGKKDRGHRHVLSSTAGG